MNQFKDPNRVPPGGYQYKQPESGKMFAYPYYVNLVNAVRAHRIENNYPLGANFLQELVDYNCEINPDWCENTSGPSLAQKAASFAIAMKQWVQNGMKVVDFEEWTRRRAICASCTELRGDAGDWSVSCGRCGCNVAKLKLVGTQGCPLGKW